MNIVMKRTDEIVPYENNPRRNTEAVKYVANSIKEFGFKQPIVIDKNGVIVAGHTRWLASRTLGLEEVPCIMADDLSDEQIKAYRLADNKVADVATWDWDALIEELGDISLDMTEFGFEVSDTKIDWDDVDEVTEDNYEAPPKKELRCPACGHIDSAERFVKVSADEDISVGD